ncbi:MAG TPA: YeeE/YedE thiosulfate transporter family protein [Thermodesulfobacteriota bacterium]|nr:YeeE/YedE thiosulfate transporter family protein [Thermodesulfobacteriota bacterium]
MKTGAATEGKTGFFRRPAWPPYVVGAAIGGLETFAMLTAKRPLGVTTAFETTAALAAKRLAPGIMDTDRFERERGEAPKIDWQWALVAGVLLGSSLSRRISREQNQAVDTGPADRKPSLPVRYGQAALGGALMMFGARMAKGCTSGHGISGTMQFAASSWLFTPIIFGVGAAVARMLHGRNR